MICGICIICVLSRQAAMVTACPYCNYHEKYAYCSFCMNAHRSNNSYKSLTFLLFDDIFIIERLIMLQTDSASSCKYSITFFCFSFLLKFICILFLTLFCYCVCALEPLYHVAFLKDVHVRADRCIVVLRSAYNSPSPCLPRE